MWLLLVRAPHFEKQGRRGVFHSYGSYSMGRIGRIGRVDSKKDLMAVIMEI